MSVEVAEAREVAQLRAEVDHLRGVVRALQREVAAVPRQLLTYRQAAGVLGVSYGHFRDLAAEREANGLAAAIVENGGAPRVDPVALRAWQDERKRARR